MESVKKSIDERALHKREYDTRVNERQIQTTEGKIDTGKAWGCVGNDALSDDAYPDPFYDEEPRDEVQRMLKPMYLILGIQHLMSNHLDFNNKGEVDQNAEQCHETCPLPAKLTDKKTIEPTNQSLEFEDICLKKIVA
ncbi:hypothetical protein Tco_1482604 [Tanacetum coccineum]